MSDTIQKKALELLRSASTPQGIMASLNTTDNYKRIWARDSVITGLAGMWSRDSDITEALRQSLITLGNAQAKTGQIPSNVQIEPPRISFGGLTGRTDATLWWIIGVCEYMKATGKQVADGYEKKMEHALEVLKAWQYNLRGLIYSPLGGNWADEYVTQGYTLYDNALYLWALELSADALNNRELRQDAIALRASIARNYRLDRILSDDADFHPTARANAPDTPPYWVAALAPNGYDTRFDMAGNALAEYLKIGTPETTFALNNWLEERVKEQGNWLLPVFHPIIKEDDRDWALLSNNYAYKFKNYPHHFHNGGAWPVWLGFLAFAMRRNGFADAAASIQTQIHTCLSTEEPPFSFYEYWATDTFKPGGTSNLCFTAAGTLYAGMT